MRHWLPFNLSLNSPLMSDSSMTCYLCTFLGGNTNTRDLALHLSVMYGLLTCSETGPESVLACWGSGRREVGYKAYSLPAIPEHNADSGEVPLGTCQTGEELHPPALQQRAPLPARNPPPLYVALMGHWGADDTEESALALVLVFSDCFHSGWDSPLCNIPIPMKPSRMV